MFHPNLGRWLQQDPIGFDAGDVNLYRALDNSPVNLVDPSGLEGQKASVTVSARKRARLVAEIGKFQLPPIPAGLDVHTNVSIQWVTYRGTGWDRTKASSGGYVVWLKGREIVDKLRDSTMTINLSPLHGGHNWTNPDPGEPPPKPLPGYPNLKTPEEFDKYIEECFNARGTSGTLTVVVRTKGYEQVQDFVYQKPVGEPTGPTETPGNMPHPSRPGKPPGPVRPNRLQRLGGANPFFRQLAPWSTEQPPFWEKPAKYDESITVTVNWQWPANARDPSFWTSVQ